MVVGGGQDEVRTLRASVLSAQRRIAARQAPPRPSAQGAGRRTASLPASPRREATAGSVRDDPTVTRNSGR